MEKKEKKDNKKPYPEQSRRVRIFSGSRPTGFLHLGNYLGGLKGYIELQNKKKYDCIYAVVDLHGITSPYNPKTYQDNVREVVLEYSRTCRISLFIRNNLSCISFRTTSYLQRQKERTA